MIDPLPSKPLTRFEISALVLTGLALIAVLKLKLLGALLAGLLVYELSLLLVRLVRFRTVSSSGARLMASGLLILILGSLLTLAGVGLYGLMRNGSDTLPALLQKMAEIIESSRDRLPVWMVAYLPANAAELQASLGRWLRENAHMLQLAGAETGRALAQIIIGFVIGALLALSESLAIPRTRALAVGLRDRAIRLRNSFRRVVVAQGRIAAINAGLTWLYLGVGLPLFGVDLPLVKTMVAVTFVVGLMPVLGNLISNTVIIIVSLSHSAPIALVSLTYLVVIHKLEYFLNARIIGGKIDAHAWELLIAMLVMEAVFGITGLIAAPIYYAYLKDELKARGLV